MPQFKNWSHQISENNSNAFLGWWKNLYVRVKFQWGKRKVVKKRCQISTVKEKFELGEKKRCKRRGEIKVVRKTCRTKRNTSQAGVEPASLSLGFGSETTLSYRRRCDVFLTY